MEQKKVKEARIDAMKDAKKKVFQEKAKLRALSSQRAADQRDIKVKTNAMKIRFKAASIEERLNSTSSTANQLKAQRMERQKVVEQNRKKVSVLGKYIISFGLIIAGSRGIS